MQSTGGAKTLESGLGSRSELEVKTVLGEKGSDHPKRDKEGKGGQNQLVVQKEKPSTKREKLTEAFQNQG